VYQHWVTAHALRKSPRFRLTFTPDHNHTVSPHRLDAYGAVNCSKDDYYGWITDYDDCLLDSECRVGSAQCPHTGVTCQGQVTSGNKCLFYVKPDAEDLALNKTAAAMCARRGGHLPVLRTKAELGDFVLLLAYSKNFKETNKLCATLLVKVLFNSIQFNCFI
jgi:hypothetical protein